MKTLTQTDPAKATELLHQAPQLSYAIFQALLLMGLVSTDALASVVEGASNVAPVPAVPLPVPTSQPNYALPPPGSYPPGYPPPPPHMSGQLGIPIGTPPYHGQAYQPPPPPVQQRPPPQQAAPQASAQVLPDTEALMQQVLAMPQEVIDSLPPADRAQLLALRASYGR